MLSSKPQVDAAGYAKRLVDWALKGHCWESSMPLFRLGHLVVGQSLMQLYRAVETLEQ